MRLLVRPWGRSGGALPEGNAPLAFDPGSHRVCSLWFSRIGRDGPWERHRFEASVPFGVSGSLSDLVWVLSEPSGRPRPRGDFPTGEACPPGRPFRCGPKGLPPRRVPGTTTVPPSNGWQGKALPRALRLGFGLSWPPPPSGESPIGGKEISSRDRVRCPKGRWASPPFGPSPLSPGGEGRERSPFRVPLPLPLPPEGGSALWTAPLGSGILSGFPFVTGWAHAFPPPSPEFPRANPRWGLPPRGPPRFPRWEDGGTPPLVSVANRFPPWLRIG